jgi:hypothetical protein
VDGTGSGSCLMTDYILAVMNLQTVQTTTKVLEISQRKGFGGRGEIVNCVFNVINSVSVCL